MESSSGGGAARGSGTAMGRDGQRGRGETYMAHSAKIIVLSHKTEQVHHHSVGCRRFGEPFARFPMMRLSDFRQLVAFASSEIGCLRSKPDCAVWRKPGAENCEFLGFADGSIVGLP